MIFDIDTPDGFCRATVTTKGIARLSFPDRRRRVTETPAGTAAEKRHAQRLCRELQAYLTGKRLSFTVPLDLSGYTEFRIRVWQRMCRIPWGETVSYGELAAAVGCGSARAVGQACGDNPVPIIIPCHRVVAAHGRLGGFGHGRKGWLAIKRNLLDLEGVSLL